MEGLELMREGEAPLMRREQDGVHREVRSIRQVSWDEVARAVVKAKALETTHRWTGALALARKEG